MSTWRRPIAIISWSHLNSFLSNMTPARILIATHDNFDTFQKFIKRLISYIPSTILRLFQVRLVALWAALSRTWRTGIILEGPGFVVSDFTSFWVCLSGCNIIIIRSFIKVLCCTIVPSRLRRSVFLGFIISSGWASIFLSIGLHIIAGWAVSGIFLGSALLLFWNNTKFWIVNKLILNQEVNRKIWTRLTLGISQVVTPLAFFRSALLRQVGWWRSVTDCSSPCF